MPVFKKPTWHNVVSYWNYNAIADVWVPGDDPITGQVYTVKRGQDDPSGGTMYFEYPKDLDVLRDRADRGGSGKTDAVSFLFPTDLNGAFAGQREVGYWVRDVTPRWLGFSNEHIIATLEKMTPGELAMVKAGVPAPGAPSSLTVLFASATEPYADGLHLANVWLEVKDINGVPVPYAPYALSWTGSAVQIMGPPATAITDRYGRAYFGFTNLVDETTVWTVVTGGVTDTAEIDWLGPIDPPATGGDLDLSSVADNGCGSCGDLNDIWPVTADLTPGDFTGTPFDFDCAPDGPASCVFRFIDSGGVCSAHLLRVSDSALLCSWYNMDTSAWDRTSNLTLAEVSQWYDMGCNLNGSLMVFNPT